MTQNCNALHGHLESELHQLVYGMVDPIRGLTIALIARGHVLLEGPPGLGKTRLSKGFAQVIGGTFKRLQGTADLMPADVTGVHVYNSQAQSFEFQPGPLFADVLLVDEINRAGPKTQSALLEAMQERQVSVDRDTFPLPEDFLVVATQNPREFEGTFPLPESQLDRFALSIPVSYLEREEEARVLATLSVPDDGAASTPALTPVARSLIDAARAEVAEVHLDESLVGYVLDIAAATRDSGHVNLGLSIRGALALSRCARIEAALRGGEFVVPDDVQAVAHWVVPHRLVLTAEAAIEGITPAQECQRILDNLPVPK